MSQSVRKQCLLAWVEVPPVLQKMTGVADFMCMLGWHCGGQRVAMSACRTGMGCDFCFLRIRSSRDEQAEVVEKME